MAYDGNSDGALPKVADIIEKLGFGPFTIKEIMLGASVWLAAGSQLIIVSAITSEISQDWKLEMWERSWIVSILFVGAMFGNFASGPCSDIAGRRLPILICYATVVVFSFASASATGFWSMCCARFLLGIAFGFGQPAWNSLGSEITPHSWRLTTNVVASTLFVAGEIYGAAFVWLEDPEMKNLDWQYLTIMGTAPAAVMGLMCLFFLHESASWLASQGKTETAMEVLKNIRLWNRKEHVSIEFAPPQHLPESGGNLDAVKQQVEVATGKVLGFTTGVLCFSCFVLNFVFYGSFYCFPLVLGKVDMGVSPAVALMLGALWELPGYVFAILFGMICGRRVGTISYCGLMVLSIAMFVEGAKRQKAGSTTYPMLAEVLLWAGFGGIKCWINMGFSIVYQYASEIYPTNARVAGTGICFGCGRIGAMVAPFVFEGMTHGFYKSWQSFFYLLAFICVVNAIFMLFLPYDTASMTLKDHVDEMGETAPLVSCTGTDRKVKV